jgi:beta-fructofuranosidase
MRKRRLILFTLAVLLAGCSNEPSTQATQASTEDREERGSVEEVMIFPKTDEALIGDTMPFYDNGRMNIFYLADQRDGKTGYHPWALFTTEDYCTYDDLGVVIPYADSAMEQDIALGTGCVMKDFSGLYHAFYTGHNDYYEPTEAIMHATSNDMLTWTKQPDDTFFASERYSSNDFRDPYVFYVDSEQKYWMLVVTRSEGSGVIAKYTSKDLKTWEDEGIFFEDDMGYGTNMECPSLLQYKGKWYLAFSDQWPDRVVHYRVADSVNGPFAKPDVEAFDCNGFYAGRLETDGDHLYVVGWNGTKYDHDDANDYDWAGNVVVHQLEQKEDGSLVPVPNEKVVAKMNHALNNTPTLLSDSVEYKDGAYQFSGNLYELARFEAGEDMQRIEADISGFGSDAFFGIGFAPNIENVCTLNYVFNVPENRIEFYNTEVLVETDAQSYIDFDFASHDKIHVSIFSYGGVVCMYINDELAMTARMYRSQGTDWQIFSVNSSVKWENVELYE